MITYFLCLIITVGLCGNLAADTVKLSRTSSTGFYSGSDWGDGGSEISDLTDYEVSGYLGLKVRNAEDRATAADNPLTFPGKSLRIGNPGNTDYGILYFPNGWATWYVDFPSDGLFLTRGQIQLQQNGLVLHLLGKITVETAAGATFNFNMAAKTSTTVHIDAELLGDENASLAFVGTVADQNIFLTGDMSGYHGVISVDNPGMSVTVGTGELAGGMSVESNVVITTVSASDIAGFGSLSFADGVRLALKTDPDTGTNAQFKVAESFSAEGKVYVTASDYFVRTGTKLRPDAAAWETAGDGWRSPLLTAPQGQIDPQAFVFAGFQETHNDNEGSIFYGGCFNAHFELTRNADGTETLFFVQEPIVFCLNTKVGRDYSRGGYMEYSSCTNADDWSDGRLPHPGAHYLVSWHAAAHSKTGASFTPYFTTPQNVDDYVFPGDSLTIASHAHLASPRSVTVSNLRITENGKIYFYRDGFTFNGDIETVGDGAHYLFATEERRVCIDGDLKGLGTLYIGGQANHGGWYVGGEIEFKGDNGYYAGSIVVTNFLKAGATGSNYPATNERVFLNSAGDLGADLGNFDHDAVVLANKASLRPQRDIAFTYENRGLLVQGEGDVTVPEGVRLTMAMPITYAGCLAKYGDGTVAFATAPRFGDGCETTAPTAGENVLSVHEGYVQPLGSDVFDGLDIRFAGAAGLVFSAVPAGDLALFGVRLETASAFTGESAIPVTIDPDTLPEKGEVTVALFTMPRDELDLLLGKLRFVRPKKECQMTALVYSGDDSETTVSATYKVDCGLRLILR